LLLLLSVLGFRWFFGCGFFRCRFFCGGLFLTLVIVSPPSPSLSFRRVARDDRREADGIRDVRPLRSGREDDLDWARSAGRR